MRRPARTFRLLAPALAAAAGLAALGPVAPALAASHPSSFFHLDPAGDVVRFDDTTPDDGPGTPAPDQTNGDATSFNAVHGPARVSFTTTYRSLSAPTAASGDLVFHSFSLRTSAGRGYDYTVVVGPGRPQGVRELDRANGNTVRCRGLRSRIDYADATITASIPRSCLGSPRWVRAGGGAGVLTGFLNDNDPSAAAYFDDALRNGSVGDDLALSPRLYRASASRGGGSR